MKKKFISIILMVALIFTVLSANVFAASVTLENIYDTNHPDNMYIRYFTGYENGSNKYVFAYTFFGVDPAGATQNCTGFARVSLSINYTNGDFADIRETSDTISLNSWGAGNHAYGEVPINSKKCIDQVASIHEVYINGNSVYFKTNQYPGTSII